MRDRGVLITAIFDYVIDGETSEKMSKTVDFAYTMISAQLNRDVAKYNERRQIARRNGALGGRPRKSEKTEKTSGFSEEPDETFNTTTNTTTNTNTNITTTTSTYTDTAQEGGGGVTESDFEEFWRVYPKHTGRNDARSVFFEMVRTREESQELISLVERWKNSEAWRENNGKFISKAANFLADHFPTRDDPPPNSSSFDMNEFYEAALRRSYEVCPLGDPEDRT